MHIDFLNYILALSTWHKNRNTALAARGDEGICFLHCARKTDGDQQILPFRTREAIRKIEELRAFQEAIVLGYHTIDRRILDLAEMADGLFTVLVEQGKAKPLEVSFAQQLINRLLLASEALADNDLPEGHSFWRLCLVGTKQEVYVPADIPVGGLSLLPGKVLGDFYAPKDLVSATQLLLEGEQQKELLQEEAQEEAHEEMQQALQSLIAKLFRDPSSYGDDEPGSDDWRRFGNN